MNPLDAEFLGLYTQYETDTPPQSRAEMDATLEAVLAKQAGVIPFEKTTVRQKPRRAAFFTRRRVLVAAAALCAVLLMAAGVMKVADLFRDILREQGPDGAPAPISSMAPIVNQTGTLPNASVTSGGVTVTAQGLVGDNQSLKVLLEVAGPEGQPLAIKQPDGSYSTGEIQFGRTWFAPASVDDANPGFGFGLGSQVIDDDPSDNKLNILLDISAVGQELGGGRFLLHLQDLVQFAALEGASLGLSPGQLHAAVSAFGPVADSAFVRNGHEEDPDGTITYSYELAVDSGSEVELTPDFTLTNAAIRDGFLYLRGRTGDTDAFGEMTRGAELRGADGGVIATAIGWGWGDDGSCTVAFTGIEDLSELEGAEWWYGVGEDMHPLATGSWEFELDLAYMDLAVKAQLDDTFTWDGYAFTAAALEVSPYTVYIDFSADAATQAEILPPLTPFEHTPQTAWQKGTHAVQLHMKDGSVITADNASSKVEWLDGGGAKLSFTFVLDVVIDPAEVEKVTIGDLTIDAERLVA